MGIQEQIEVMHHFADGGEVERKRTNTEAPFLPVSRLHIFNFEDFEYRIKPFPELIEGDVYEFDWRENRYYGVYENEEFLASIHGYDVPQARLVTECKNIKHYATADKNRREQ